METKLYRKIPLLPNDRDKIRLITFSAQMADIPKYSVFGSPYIVRVSYNGFNDNKPMQKEYIIVSDSPGNALLSFIHTNTVNTFLVSEYLITKIEVIETDIIVDTTKRIGM